MCGGQETGREGEREGEGQREREGGRERGRTSGLSQSVRFFFPLISCNGPCAPKEKWQRREHIIIIIIIKRGLVCHQGREVLTEGWPVIRAEWS